MIDTKGFTYMFSIIGMHQSLTVLDLSNSMSKGGRNKLGDRSCVDIAQMLKANGIISIVNLANNQITDKGMEMLIESVEKSQSLISFNISGNLLTSLCCTANSNTGRLPAVYRLLKKDQLIEINLANNKIGDKGIEELLGSPQPYGNVFESNTSCLSKLCIGANEITCHGINKLMGNLRMPSLTLLNLDGNQLNIGVLCRMQ